MDDEEEYPRFSSDEDPNHAWEFERENDWIESACYVFGIIASIMLTGVGFYALFAWL